MEQIRTVSSKVSELRADGSDLGPPACVMAAAVLPTSQTRVTPSTLPSPYHNNHGRYPRSPAERFAERYIPEPNTGCWLWDGGLYRDGYGCFKIGGTSHKAHRVSWMLAHGEMPKLHVLHRCDTPACVNPKHLFTGDQISNIADMHAKSRYRNGWQRLTAEQRSAIAQRRAAGESPGDLAREFGISSWYAKRVGREQLKRAAPKMAERAPVPPDPLFLEWLKTSESPARKALRGLVP